MDPGEASFVDQGMDFDLDQSQGAWAVSHARSVVESAVQETPKPGVPADLDTVFDVERGAFVTLRKGGELRGCIGRPRPKQPAIEALRVAAIGAATDDPRFPPVTPGELNEITVEVSILTPPRELENPDPEGVTVGKDGLIVERNGRSGLLLPQVPVEQDWDANTFLEQTCRKAGLDGEYWEDPETDVRRFSAQVFTETAPNGSIEQVDQVNVRGSP